VPSDHDLTRHFHRDCDPYSQCFSETVIEQVEHLTGMVCAVAHIGAGAKELKRDRECCFPAKPKNFGQAPVISNGLLTIRHFV
jgi:hypothetical protein